MTWSPISPENLQAMLAGKGSKVDIETSCSLLADFAMVVASARRCRPDKTARPSPIVDGLRQALRGLDRLSTDNAITQHLRDEFIRELHRMVLNGGWFGEPVRTVSETRLHYVLRRFAGCLDRCLPLSKRGSRPLHETSTIVLLTCDIMSVYGFRTTPGAVSKELIRSGFGQMLPDSLSC